MADGVRFPSRVDAWCLPPVVAVLAVALILSQSRGFVPVAAMLLTGALALTLWILMATDYTLSGADLVVRCGPSKRHVPLKQIERVRPVQTLLSAPALSFKRLEVSGSFGAVVISPSEQNAFLLALQSSVPNLRLEGGLEARPPGRTSTTLETS